MRTRTDTTTSAKPLDDELVRFREWSTQSVHPLPAEPGEHLLGADPACWLVLGDPSGRISRQHAELVRDGNAWILRDRSSKNGILVDGVRRAEVTLEPGLEVGLGGITLIVESTRTIALRGYLARVLGYTSNEVVDLALRSIRMASARRAPLVLCGDGDLVPIAAGLHRRTHGDRPFVLCDPRRKTSEATVRSAASYDTGAGALAVATGGTLCVLSKHLPKDFSAISAELRAPGSRVQLVVCTHTLGHETFLAAPITIPPLARRTRELNLVIEEYAAEAVAALAAAPTSFGAAERDWIKTHAADSLPEIEKATLRLVALREEDNTVTRAAARLGISHVSLLRWIGRRRLPR
ncbi:MAG TPA: FHA domain-containing protein [Kofleriaceae bacterium]